MKTIIALLLLILAVKVSQEPFSQFPGDFEATVMASCPVMQMECRE